MKRLLYATTLSTLICAAPLFAQDTAASAARQAEAARAMEERFNTFLSDLDQLKATSKVQDQEIVRLRSELARVTEENRRLSATVANNNNNSIEAIKTLKEKITEVDSHRETDHKTILEEVKSEIAKLDKSVQAIAEAFKNCPVHKDTPKPATPAAPEVSETGVRHTVAKGEFPSKILAAYNNTNSGFRKPGQQMITLKQLKAANPNLDLSKPLLAGTEIIIPDPLDAPKPKSAPKKASE